MTISRRDALKTLAAGSLSLGPPSSGSSGRQAGDPPGQTFEATLRAIADVVLPSAANKDAAVRAFTEWIANYKEGADTDHGYGNTRVRPTGPSPSRHYAAQVAALDAAAVAKGGAGFAAATVEHRRAILEAAFADAKVERLPARPTGAHIATDLMGHYFNSSAANDLCYRAAIGRDDCRGLPGSDLPPEGGSYRKI